MNQKKWSKSISILVACIMLFVFAAGCGGGNEQGNAAKTDSASSEQVNSENSGETPPPLLEYSIFISSGTAATIQKLVNNPNDIVTPYIEKKFNIKVKEFRFPSDQSDMEAFVMFQAAGNLPDVWSSSQTICKLLAAKGQFADLSSEVEEMTNYKQYISPSIWPRWSLDGKKYFLPCVAADKNEERFASNPYILGNSGWNMWIREDILAKCGYKFTPMAEIKKNFTDVGKIPTMEDLRIEPAIDTPEKYIEFLRKVKELDLKVGDKKVAPLNTQGWSVFHMSAMFDNGHWRINENGEVDGYLGLPGAKTFYRTWSQLYREGLIDKDYLTQKDDQLQQKIASGLVASGLYIPDATAARQENLKRDPAAEIRPLPMPKDNQNYGFFDVFENGFQTLMINKDFSDIKRLTQYFDWFYSEEGQDILTWGPESAGLWEMKDGKKQFKAEVAQDILDNKTDGKNATYYGIYNPAEVQYNYPCKAALAIPYLDISMKDWRLSYPTKLDVYRTVEKVYGKNVNCGLNLSGTASYGDGGEITAGVNNWYWNEFLGTQIAKLLQAKSDAEYDKAWDTVYEKFVKEAKYDEAKANMVKWFQEFGKK